MGRLPRATLTGIILRTVIHQPNFLPRLKVLQKLASADTWVVLDSVQFCAREWQNRARIVALHGSSQAHWLSVPVHRPQGRATLLRDVILVDPPATIRLVHSSLYHALRRAPQWTSLQSLLDVVATMRDCVSLTRFCTQTTLELLKTAGTTPQIIYSSTLPLSGKASQLMANICAHIGAGTYLADSGAMSYLNPDHFGTIPVLWQQWEPPAARWQGIPSWRNVSAINYLCREGPEEFRMHITGGCFVSQSHPSR